MRRKVVWQSCSAQREECHAVEKNFRVFHTSKLFIHTNFPLKKCIMIRTRMVARSGVTSTLDLERSDDDDWSDDEHDDDWSGDFSD